MDNATGIHAAALATPCVIRHFPEEMKDASSACSTYDPASTFILYPSTEACTADEVAASLENARQATIIVPDTKWNNDGAVLSHPSLRGIRHLKLRYPPAKSAIWRSNARATAGCVSTIEAIYCLAREWRQAISRHGALQAPAEEAAGEAAAIAAAQDVSDAASHQEDATPCSDEDHLLLLFAVTRHAIRSQGLVRLGSCRTHKRERWRP